MNENYYFYVTEDEDAGTLVIITEAAYFDANDCCSDWELSDSLELPDCILEEVTEGTFCSADNVDETRSQMLEAGFRESDALAAFLNDNT